MRSHTKNFPEMKLSVFPHEIQNFGNSIADISTQGQFRAYLQLKEKKYENTFIVTNPMTSQIYLAMKQLSGWVY